MVDKGTSREPLESLRGQGIVGVAFNFALHGPEFYGNADGLFLRALFRMDYGLLLKLAERTLTDPTDRWRVMWETPRRLFGF